jgi:hypothetical protein
MDFRDRVKDLIRNAMRTSCEDAEWFSEDKASGFNVEYLLTINTAKALRELCSSPSIPYQIYLEKRTRPFCRACFPLFHTEMRGRIPRVLSPRRISKLRRNGRIDIAIFEDDRALCAIELKGFNPEKKAVTQDLHRNAQYFSLVADFDQTEMKSQLPLSFFAAIFKSTRKDLLAISEEGVRARMKTYLREVEIPSDVQVTMEVFTVSHDPKGQSYLEEHGGDEFEVHIERSEHHFIGVIVCFEQSKNENPLTH